MNSPRETGYFLMTTYRMQNSEYLSEKDSQIGNPVAQGGGTVGMPPTDPKDLQKILLSSVVFPF